MITIPSWIISVLCIVFGILLYQRARTENNILLYGKIGALAVIAIIYFLFDTDFFDIFTARSLARIAWVIYLIAEITYHYSKAKWISNI